jgi:hypothetical protein
MWVFTIIVVVGGSPKRLKCKFRQMIDSQDVAKQGGPLVAPGPLSCGHQTRTGCGPGGDTPELSRFYGARAGHVLPHVSPRTSPTLSLRAGLPLSWFFSSTTKFYLIVFTAYLLEIILIYYLLLITRDHSHCQ